MIVSLVFVVDKRDIDRLSGLLFSTIILFYGTSFLMMKSLTLGMVFQMSTLINLIIVNILELMKIQKLPLIGRPIYFICSSIFVEMILLMTGLGYQDKTNQIIEKMMQRKVFIYFIFPALKIFN